MTAPLPPPDETAFAHLWAMAEQLLACLCDNLEAAGVPVCACVIMPGDQVVADWCDSESEAGKGMAWIRLVSYFPSQRFPLPATDERATCGGAFPVAELELGTLRCMYSSGDIPVDPARVTLDAKAQWRDSLLLRWVACTCPPAGFKRLIGAYTPMSGGGCVGGRLNMTIQLNPGIPIQE